MWPRAVAGALRTLYGRKFSPPTNHFSFVYKYLIFLGYMWWAQRIRTYDPLIKSQLLYHLSYAP